MHVVEAPVPVRVPAGRDQPLAGDRKLQILIIDDHKLFAEALQAVLAREGMAEPLLAETGAEGIELARAKRPDVVLVDVGLPDQSGLVVGRKIVEACPDAKVLVLTALEDPWTVEEALRIGFHGYLTKDTKIRQFETSIRAVMDGQVVVPSSLARRSEPRPRGSWHADLLAQQLTPREREVLQLLAEGATGRQIARRLRIAPNTVRTHVQSILAKLQAHSRLEAVAFAVRHNIVRLQPSGE